MQRVWKEDKTPVMKRGLGKHMPKETSRQQVTNSDSRHDRLALPTDTFNILGQQANEARTLQQWKTKIY